MPSSKPWVRLNDIAENIERVRRYVGDMSLDQFVADEKSADATERCMLRISEAAVKLGSFAEKLLPGHDWSAIRGTGNILRHDYDRVSIPMIYDTVVQNFEPLLNDLRRAISAHDQAER